ncbi:THUMP domain-containing proteins [Phaffia rhodozyma]|uniref:THUMP domain-containing proteins n=1 Tax=Phaffia rhodozyma TaxID=264483 RepID=A0A0F7SRN9_PHARH|nr:THUMP domain-containing proteins [Phaffia rhodozyma]
MAVDNRQKKKKQYRSDGTYIGGTQNLSGPGVWVTGLRSKERQSVAEMYQVLESLVEELYPGEQEKYRIFRESFWADEEKARLAATAAEEGDDFEDELAKELAELKLERSSKTKKKASLIVNKHTDIDCIMFFSLHPPIDPLHLVLHYANQILRTGVSQTRTIQRITPVSYSCRAELDEVIKLVKEKVYPGVFETQENLRFRIDHHSVQNQTLEKATLLKGMAEAVPADRGHIVDLSENAQWIVLVRIVRNTVSIGLIPSAEFIRFKKFNVPSIVAAAGLAKDEAGEGLRSGRVAASSGIKMVEGENI